MITNLSHFQITIPLVIQNFGMKSEEGGENKTLENIKTGFGDWVETKMDSGKTLVRLKTFEEFRSKLQVPDSFLVIKSEEVTSSFEKKPIHINVSNIVEKIDPIRGTSVLDVMQRTLDAVHEQRKRLKTPCLLISTILILVTESVLMI